MGRRLGDAVDPLLVSVRSGRPFSMPGMMDTVLNLGLNDEAVEGLAKQTSDERFAYDSYRRFIALFGRIVLDTEAPSSTSCSTRPRASRPPRPTDAVPAELLQVPGPPLPAAHRRAVPSGPEGAAPRGHRGGVPLLERPSGRRLPHPGTHRPRLGTAVNVQAMVFGNRDDNSGTGVGFTRDPATGAQGSYGDFLRQRPGRGRGGRHPQDPAAVGARGPVPGRVPELHDIFARLERHYRDMLDTEFTIEQGKLWMLQTRVGKRTGRAALRMAVDMTVDPDIRLDPHRGRVAGRPRELDQVLHPEFVAGERSVLATGLGASPGAGVGRVYFTPTTWSPRWNVANRRPGAHRDLAR